MYMFKCFYDVIAFSHQGSVLTLYMRIIIYLWEVLDENLVAELVLDAYLFDVDIFMVISITFTEMA